MSDEEIMEYDVVIVGAGPAGLSAAIRLKQLSPNISVCILEKGSEVGAHILSGCVLDPRALNELIPDWREKGLQVTKPTQDNFLFLTKKHAIKLPTPPQLHNDGNYIVSLSNVCKWLATQAELLGVEIFAGFPAVETLIENDRVVGVLTGEFGVDKNGEKKQNYQAGMKIKAKYTLFAEGCRGSLSQKLMDNFNLREECNPQTYGLGIKEIWKILPENYNLGSITHTVGWPMSNDTYGGSFMYHTEDNKVSIGFVIGLDYKNPHLDPFKEFQRFKTHPAISKILTGGTRISYGARSLNEGGFQSIPKLVFPGGAIVGASAGFMDVPKVKGTHTTMKSAMLAAEAIDRAIKDGDVYLQLYPQSLEESWVYKDLYKSRNIRPSFRYGLIPGLIYSAIDAYIFRGKAPWTFKNHHDHHQLKTAIDSKKIDYPLPDNKLTFDRLSSVFLSSTNHTDNQLVHLALKNTYIPIDVNLPLFDAPEQRYCPAGVYEIVEENGEKKLQINSQNCLHCKTCDIKDPAQNITWNTPEGGGGPNYSGT